MVKFIADIGSNHNQDLGRIKKLIEKAKEIGCYGVKFQLFNPEKLYAPGFGPGIEALKERALPTAWIENIRNICDDIDIKFGCTPFDLESVDLLDKYVDFLKISAWDAKRIDLIEKCANTNIPLIISVGLLDSDEIKKILYHATFNMRKHIEGKKKVYLLHSFSDYPTNFIYCNLNKISEMIFRFSHETGWSDHTVEPGVIYAAWQQGAKLIEFHLDLEDMEGWESDHCHCWNPDGIRAVIDDINRIAEYSIYSFYDIDMKDKIIEDHIRDMADPEDGMRPLKEFRNAR